MATPNTCFNLRYLGHSVVSKFIPGLGILQKPLHDIYVNYLTPKGPAVPTICRLALTDRGILLTANGRDSFYSMRDVLLWEPVQWVYVQTQDRKIMSAFEPLNPDHHLSQEGLFSKLDGQYRYLAQLKHEPILSMALKKSSDSKQIEVHAFVCVSDDQAFEVSKALWRAEQVFLEQEAKGIGCANCSPAQPAIQGQEAPRSVRSPSGGGQLQVSTDHSSFKGRKQSLRQGRGRKVDGEITLEELIRLADQATEPDGGGGGGWGSVAQEPPPPFMMGESWEAKERHKGVQRSRTFNEGQAANNEHWMAGGGGGVSDSQPQQAPCYENLVPLQENVPKNSTPPTKGLLQQQQQQPEAPGVHQRHLAVAPVDSPQVNQRQKNPAPPASLRAVIADSKLSAANGKRPSVLPGTEFSNAVNHIAVEPQQNPVDDDDDDDGPLPQNGQSKPVALVQPRKVPRYKVLPDAAPESAAFLRKVGGQKEDDHHRHHSGSAAKEQYLQAGLGGSGGGGGASGRSYTRSMHEIDSSAGPKSVTPQPRRRTKDLLDAAADPATPKQLTGSDLNLSAAAAAARRKSSVVPDPVKKLSAPEQRTSPSSSLAAAAAGAGHMSGGGERRKQEDTEGLESMNSDFDRNMMKTMLTHGTNFESALGYFP